MTRPLHHNGQPYSGINILMLGASAVGRDDPATSVSGWLR